MIPSVTESKPNTTMSAMRGSPGPSFWKIASSEYDNENADIADGLADQTLCLALVDHG